MATMAIIPKASLTISPPIVWQAPMTKGGRNVAVIGPDATPPESKAIAVNIFGQKGQADSDDISLYDEPENRDSRQHPEDGKLHRDAGRGSCVLSSGYWYGRALDAGG